MEKESKLNKRKALNADLPVNARNSKHEARYYGSYGDPAIHEEMLKDTVRVDTYKQAIEDALKAKPGAIFLDVGTGTGVLAIHAAKHGASIVHAVEKATIV